MTIMRAKLQVGFVHDLHWGPDKSKSGETVTLFAVSKKEGYPADGSDEDNTYAKWSPQAEFKITIANPALWGQFTAGDRFYVDFTKAEQ